MRDQFYMVLRSNTSKDVFPNNTATRFNALLPQNVSLHGEWSVAIREIQVPLTFQHIHQPSKEDTVCLMIYKPDVENEITYRVPSGIYKSIESLLAEMNNLAVIKDHILFEIQPGGFARLSRICDDECDGHRHSLIISDKLKKIFGFEDLDLTDIRFTPINGTRPASLINGLPGMLMVYSDICEPYVTGDGQTRLLRAVPLSLHNYAYGDVEIKSFSAAMYIPLLSPSFRSIEIDIRDEMGRNIPFDYGTLTVTLHFKRIE